MDSIKLLTVILTIVLGIMVMLLIILGFVYLSSKMKKTEGKETIPQDDDKKRKTKKFKEYKTEYTKKLINAGADIIAKTSEEIFKIIVD